MLLLGAWLIWKHRNNIVFDGETPFLPRLLNLIIGEARMWAAAGNNGLANIMPE